MKTYNTKLSYVSFVSKTYSSFVPKVHIQNTQKRYINSEQVVAEGSLVKFGNIHNIAGINNNNLLANTLRATQNYNSTPRQGRINGRSFTVRPQNPESGSSNIVNDQLTNVQGTTSTQNVSSTPVNYINIEYNNGGETLDMPFHNGYTMETVFQFGLSDVSVFVLNCCAHIDTLYDKVFSSMERLTIELNGKVSIVKSIITNLDTSIIHVPRAEELLNNLLSHSNIIYGFILDNYNITFSNVSAEYCIAMLPSIREIILNLNSMQTTYSQAMMVEQRLFINYNLVSDGSEALSDSFLSLQQLFHEVSMIIV